MEANSGHRKHPLSSTPFNQQLSKAAIRGSTESVSNNGDNNGTSPISSPDTNKIRSPRVRRRPPPDLIEQPKETPPEHQFSSNKIHHDFDDIIHSLETEIENFNFDSDPRKSDSQNDFHTPPSSIPMSEYNTDYSNSTNSVVNLNLSSKERLGDYGSSDLNTPYPIDERASSPYFGAVNNQSSGYLENLPSIPSQEDPPHQFDDSYNFPPRPQLNNNNYSDRGPSTYDYTGSKLDSPTTSRSSDPFDNAISTPITNMNYTNSGMTSETTKRNPPSGNFQPSHRKSTSFSSIGSANGYKNVNLVTLKKTLNLKPGEGERSNYVAQIRKNAGTAYNESGPGKWKLPTGISPIDKRATYTTSNGKYMRMVGGISQSKAKKSNSGVELKHGHLAPRLLAAEVDDNDDSLSMSGAKNKSPTSTLRNSGASIKSNISSTTNSLSRTVTDNSVVTSTHTSNDESTKDNSTRKLSVHSSDSSGSLSDDNVVPINGYYQHPGYKYDDIDDDAVDERGELHSESGTEFHTKPVSDAGPNPDPDATEVEQVDIDDNSFNDLDNYDNNRPKLVLANPDYSDSD